MWSVKFEVWSAKSAVCSVRCGVSREGHGRDRVSLNYRSFMFGKLPPPACPGLCYFLDMCYEFCHVPGWSWMVIQVYTVFGLIKSIGWRSIGFCCLAYVGPT